MSFDDDNNDDMAELFSFGSEEANPYADGGSGPESGKTAVGDLERSASENGHAGGDGELLLDDKSESFHSVRQDRAVSSDSFLDMLEGETSISRSSPRPSDTHDKETQDILDWLNSEETSDEAIVFEHSITGDAEKGADSLVESWKASTSPTSLALETTKTAKTEKKNNTGNQKESPSPPQAEATVVSLPPVFDTLSEALESKESTPQQIRDLYAKTLNHVVDASLRTELYCRMICGKTLQDTLSSSLADSFEQWLSTSSNEENTAIEEESIREQVEVLSRRIVEVQQERDIAACQRDLTKLLLYHYRMADATTAQQTEVEQNDRDSSDDKDRLVPLVATAILSAGVPLTAASVVLTQIIPNFMPLLALKPAERWEAALSLHSEFYYLACYHVPLLVFHLDRYLPGWHWPKLPKRETTLTAATEIGRNLDKQGQLPPSWLLSHLAGEWEGTRLLPPVWILRLWDRLLTVENNATRFFLILAVLEQAADQLLLLTGETLATALQDVLEFSEVDGGDPRNENDGFDCVGDWWLRARNLQFSTPECVVAKLRLAEDQAVQEALKLRRERAEAKLKARLEAEAAAHKEAQERKAEEARDRLTRARLVAFYRKHAPEKEGNINKILSVYAGRYEVLDAKLRSKYGESFNPALKPKPSKPLSQTTTKFIATMNQGLGARRKTESLDDQHVQENSASAKVSVSVLASEVLPAVCWSREAVAARGEQRRLRSIGRKPLKFYLVDSRSEVAALEQGRFPTAISLRPEACHDPERIRENEEMFESLRGAVHIVVMGEGFSALPELYGQKLSPKLVELSQEDETRTNICALFFVKKGFPFVSILEGGFAAAHSWLVREGPSNHLKPSAVLVDYDPEASVFSQMESLQNASATEKAQRTLQNLLEKSLVSMTRHAQQLESLASDYETKAGRQSLRLGLFRNKSDAKSEAVEQTRLGYSPPAIDARPGFKNALAAMGMSRSSDPEKAPVPRTESPLLQPNESPEINGEKLDTVEPTTGNDISVAKTVPGSGYHMGDTAVCGSPARPAVATTPAPVLSSTNRFAIFRSGANKPSANSKVVGNKDESSASISTTTGSVKHAASSNPFKGLGAAISSMKSSSSVLSSSTGNGKTKEKHPQASMGGMLKRNPFARFGGSGTNKADASEASYENVSTTDSRGSGGFSGSFGQLGKSALSRIRSPDEDGVAIQQAIEESISFGASGQESDDAYCATNSSSGISSKHQIEQSVTS